MHSYVNVWMLLVLHSSRDSNLYRPVGEETFLIRIINMPVCLSIYHQTFVFIPLKGSKLL